MAFLRHTSAFVFALALVFVTACGSDSPQLEGNWLLTGGTDHGTHKSITSEKAFVFRFANGEFTIPVAGGLQNKTPRSDQHVKYQLDGDKISLSDDAGAKLALKIVSHDANHLVLNAPALTKDDEINLEFDRIDDTRLAQLQATP